MPASALRDLAVSWFPFGVHIIDGVFYTVRNIEEGARQRGALVTLGTLAAGLAHELNNPAAAAARAVDALEAANEGLLSALRELALAGVSAQQYKDLDALRTQIQVPDGRVDALTVADREDELLGWLEDRDVERAWELAPTLAAAGVGTDWCQDVLDAVGKEALGPAMDWVTRTLTVSALQSQVKESTRRISELVTAVKSYSQMDRGSMQRIDVTEGLESTLVMLGHRLREGGIIVERDYGAGVPEVEAFPGELNQVWTNLIDNATDAMAGGGTLRVSTRTADDSVVVEIADTGPGMPPEVAQRAFEAFFTTKEVGQGHRPGPGHRPPHRGPAPWGHHRHRERAGQHADARDPAHHAVGDLSPGQQASGDALADQGSSRGSRTTKRVSPGEDVTSMDPPCWFTTMAWLVDSPSPVP